MNTEEFLHLLQKEGFPEPVKVEQVPNGQLDVHEHPFEVMALIIDGSIDINIDGDIKTYRSGDIFHLSFKQAHSESYGSTGVKYLASRRH